jgi:hypothetical protein
MELVTPGGSRRRAIVRQDNVSQLRDLGDRLDYVLVRFGRLVGEVADGTVPVPDFGGRVALLNSQLGFAAERLQDLIVLQREATDATPRTASENVLARRRTYPRTMERALA